MAEEPSEKKVLSANEADPLYVPLNRLAFRRDVRIFAVLDGAMFDGLPGLLKSKNLSARSLYRDGTDEGWIESGPWLVDPYRLADGRDEEDDDEDDGYGTAVLPDNDVEEGDEELAAEDLEDQADFLAARMKAALEAGDETGAGLMPTPNPDPDDPRDFAKPVYPWPQVRAVMEIADGSPGLVFWIGDESLTEPQLYRHLRTINKVLIPAGYGDDDDSNEAEPLSRAKPQSTSAFGETPAATATHEAVQFRHTDGNVLAEVMPVLDESQFSRLFGPARLLVFIAPDHPADDGSILYEAPLPDDAPGPKPGLLRLSMEQMEGVEAARLHQSRNYTISFLRKHAPEETKALSNKELYETVKDIEGHGFRLGLTMTGSHNLLAFLFIISAGEILKDELLIERLESHDTNSDEEMEAYFDRVGEIAEADAANEALL